MSGAPEGEPLVHPPPAFMKTQGCQGLTPWRASDCHVLCYHLWECQNHRPEDRVQGDQWLPECQTSNLPTESIPYQRYDFFYSSALYPMGRLRYEPSNWITAHTGSEDNLWVSGVCSHMGLEGRHSSH